MPMHMPMPMPMYTPQQSPPSLPGHMEATWVPVFAVLLTHPCEASNTTPLMNPKTPALANGSDNTCMHTKITNIYK